MPMSTRLSFKETLERLGDAKVTSPSQSDSGVVRATVRAGEIQQPVQLARFLRDNGLPLRKAHDVLTRLSAGEAVFVELRPLNRNRFFADLSALGVIADVSPSFRADHPGAQFASWPEPRPTNFVLLSASEHRALRCIGSVSPLSSSLSHSAASEYFWFVTSQTLERKGTKEKDVALRCDEPS
jgi:hypothetical protein